MTVPEIPQKKPYVVEVIEGKSYFFCACGKSNSQPFCDGSHKGSGLSPVKYAADQSKKVAFCGCKHSKGLPICDGTHKEL